VPAACRSTLAKEIRERCNLYELHCRARKLATDDELADFRPGGKENDSGDEWEYGRWLFNLARFMAREQDKAKEVADPEREAGVLAGLDAAPQSLRLLTPVGDITHLDVHPKGMHALLAMHGFDYNLKWLTDRVKAMQLEASADAAVFLGDVLEEIAYQTALAVWVATFEGPDVPWNGTRPPLDLPPWTLAVDPVDVRRLNVVFWRVNAVRLTLLRDDIEEQDRPDDRTPMTWSVFMGSLAMEKGQPVSVLMRNVSLVELLMEVKLAGQARAVARKAAEAEARQKRAGRGTIADGMGNDAMSEIGAD
jgi:hypothetical protein